MKISYILNFKTESEREEFRKAARLLSAKLNVKVPEAIVRAVREMNERTEG